jgi:hypothetical protein
MVQYKHRLFPLTVLTSDTRTSVLWNGSSVLWKIVERSWVLVFGDKNRLYLVGKTGKPVTVCGDDNSV